MELTISTQQERPLLKRTEAVVRVFYEGTTPSRAQLIPLVADKLGAKKELLIIDTIDVSFGDTVARVHCRHYTDKDALETLERKNLREKHVVEELAPEEPEAAEPKKATAQDAPKKE